MNALANTSMCNHNTAGLKILIKMQDLLYFITRTKTIFAILVFDIVEWCNY